MILRYKFVGVDAPELQKQVPPGVGVTQVGVAPLVLADFSLSSPGENAQTDLTDFLVAEGWEFVESDPGTPLGPDLLEECILESILMELRRLNVQLGDISGEEISYKDVPT